MNRIIQRPHAALAYLAGGALWLWAGDLVSDSLGWSHHLPSVLWLLATGVALYRMARSSADRPESAPGATPHRDASSCPTARAGGPANAPADAAPAPTADLDLTRYANIVESSNDVLAYVDRDLRYRVLNTPACQMLGRPRDELLGQEIRSALEP
ncbi:MAG: PAS domain-containing protein, partial [Rhodocyclaceae bacterium]|nr:PAS domain-containing protein [Rhodocyclaceae bacterium]